MMGGNQMSIYGSAEVITFDRESAFIQLLVVILQSFVHFVQRIAEKLVFNYLIGISYKFHLKFFGDNLLIMLVSPFFCLVII